MSRLDDARRREAAADRNAKIAKAAIYWLSCRDEADRVRKLRSRIVSAETAKASRESKERLANAEADLATTIRKYQP